MVSKSIMFFCVGIGVLGSSVQAADAPKAEKTHISELIAKLESEDTLYGCKDAETDRSVYTTCTQYLYCQKTNQLYTPRGIIRAHCYAMDGIRCVEIVIKGEEFLLLLDDGREKRFAPGKITISMIHPSIGFLDMPRVEVHEYVYPDLSRVVVKRIEKNI